MSVLMLTLSVSLAVSHAQCANGNSPDSLGCTPLVGEQSGDPASVTIQPRSQTGTPAADNSGAAGPLNRVDKGEAYTESAALKHNLRKTESTSAQEPVTDFQKFVFGTTGARLASFGSELFTNRAASFDTPQDAPAPPETVLGPDDELRIRVWGQVNFAANLRVSRSGEIYLPKVGAVHVAGMPFGAVAAHLKNVMGGVYRNFELSVDLGEIHSIQIYITGFARHPGAFSVSGISTLVDAVFLSGGPAAHGSMRHVQVKRAGRIVADYDLYALIASGDKTGDIQLQPGDVLYIPSAGPQVALTGSVRQPAIYELRGGQTVSQLLEFAGGMSTVASSSHLTLERIDHHSDRTVLAIPQDQTGLGTALQDGDIVRVDPITSKYSQAVTLRGSVANPGRFGWHSGMRLSELIPDRDSLLKRDYWWERTKLGLPTSPLLESEDPTTPKPAAVATSRAQTNWNYAVVERLQPETMTSKLIPFNLGKLVLEHDSTQDMELEQGDVITIFSQEDIHIPIKEQTKYIRLDGEIVHPGIYSVGQGDTLRSVVAKAGGFTGQVYVYGAVFTRASTRASEQQQKSELADRMEEQVTSDLAASMSSLSQGANQQQGLNAVRAQIARIRSDRTTGRIVLALQQLPSGEYDVPDMQLEDGDYFEVPHVPDTVQVLGAVYNPHAFLYHKGAKAGEYLQLAGGATREADRQRAYVLRADGSVATKDNSPSIFQHGLKDLSLNPGDAVVVPQKSIRPSRLANVLGVAQALSPSASTAAMAVTAMK